MSTDLLRYKDKESVICEGRMQFAKVRNVPYVLGVDGNPNKLLDENKGNCTRKHLYLAGKLVQLGYKVSLGVAVFDWEELPIPQEITGLLKDSTDTHLFLYASLDGKEDVVDATWDPQMPQGFKVNTWDGESPTQIGVPAKKIWREDFRLFQTKATVGQALRVIKNSLESKRPTPFNDAFNVWLGRTK